MILSRPLAAALLAGAAALPVQAQDWPTRPVEIVVPFGAGGSSDLAARSYAAAIQEEGLLGQPLSVVNISGHSSVGNRRVMDAEPDGYEFLLTETGLLGAHAAGITDFGYEDYKPVALTGEVCMAILVRKDSGYDTLGDLLAEASAHPSQLVYGVNIGGLNHLSGILLEQAGDGKFRFAQIGGGADNFAALTGGQTAVASVGAAGARSFTMTKDGQLSEESQVKALALLANEPDDRLPGVKTAKEQGVDVTFCYGNYWLAPADTPDAIVSAFADVLEQASQTDRIKTYYDDTLTTPTFLREAAFGAYLAEQDALVGPIARMATAN